MLGKRNKRIYPEISARDKLKLQKTDHSLDLASSQTTNLSKHNTPERAFRQSPLESKPPLAEPAKEASLTK